LRRYIFFIFPLVFLVFLFFGGSSAGKPVCLSCHGDTAFSKIDENGEKVSLYIDLGVVNVSIHNKLTCGDCHQGVKDGIHMVKPGPVDCGNCHPRISKLYQESFHGQKHLQGVKDAPWCQDCHGSHDIKSVNDPQSITYRLNLPKMCAVCHQNPQMVKRYRIPVKEPYKIYQQSIHGMAIEKMGLIKAAVCSDCHGSHTLRRASDPQSEIYKYNIPQTCGKCHFGIWKTYEESIHGKALADKLPNAPTCIDCHSEHYILPKGYKGSTVYGAIISTYTCPQCHSTEVITDKYGMVTKRVTKYLDSYHGVESRAGRRVVANCASCHGYHDTRPSTDPKSSTNLANIPQTCGKCHPKAGKNFAKGKVHLAVSPKTEIGVYIVKRIYVILIILIIGGMLLHNSVILFKRAKEKYQEGKKGVIVRFTQPEVIQHLILMITFTLLAISGFALRFPNSWWASWMVHSEEGVIFRSLIHRIAGVIFIGVCVCNLYYMLFTPRGLSQLRAILPIPQDVTLVLHNINYYLGLVKDRPPFEHYDYTEKAEYWALIWGAIVMTITGFPMWFENFFLKFMPIWLFNIFKAIHFYEALLASLAILAWHMFFMIFDPEAYPLNSGMLTGKITLKELKEKHFKEYERLKAKGLIRDTEEQEE
jgi:formate dehydrogenase gamma subunit